MALSDGGSSDPGGSFSPSQPASAAGGEAAALAPWLASARSVSSPSFADSTETAGSSCNHLQCLGLSRSWDLDWGLCSGLPQCVDPVCAVE